IAFESLGEKTALAYSVGEQIAGKYPDLLERAKKVFLFVRDRVDYTPDIDQFSHKEFAQNADELLAVIDEEGVGYGDCEDYAVLLGVMYLGAGMRSAIVLAPEHAAALVYVPEYAQANRQLTLNGESGWVWAEATGGNNPFGWMPDQYMNVELQARELVDEGLAVGELPDKPIVTVSRDAGGGFVLPVSPFFLVVFFLWLISSLGRRRSR
ncbi:transglutaminase domain-containing protein, partial [Candidatus Bipolaricaulota bacterium]|nr:transglutaminase domain-containing protein [Candidatus Bipolaricaulota bacterium]